RLFPAGTVGGTASRSPHPGPLLWGEGELSTVSRLHAGRSLPKDHRLNTNRTPAVPSLPPSRRSGALARREGGRERVRVRGKYSIAASEGSISEGLSSCLAFCLLLGGLAAEPLAPERVTTIIEALTRLGPEKVEANPKL